MRLLILYWLNAINVFMFIRRSLFWFLFKILLTPLNWLNNFFWSIFWTLFSLLLFNFDSLFILYYDRLIFLKKDVMKIFGNSSFLSNLNFVSWNCFRCRFLNSRRFLPWRTVINELSSEQLLFWLLQYQFRILRMNH